MPCEWMPALDGEGRLQRDQSGCIAVNPWAIQVMDDLEYLQVLEDGTGALEGGGKQASCFVQ